MVSAASKSNSIVGVGNVKKNHSVNDVSRDNNNSSNNSNDNSKNNMNKRVRGVPSVLFFSQLSTSMGLDDEIDVSLNLDNKDNVDDNEIISEAPDMTQPKPKSIQIIDEMES